MKNRMSDLRNHLFETLEALKDKDHPMELDRARAISGVAQTLINAAKVEVEFIEATGADARGDFFDVPQLEKRTGMAQILPAPNSARKA